MDKVCILVISLLFAAILIQYALGEPEFYLVTELGNTFLINIVESTILSIIDPIENLDPVSPETGNLLKNFIFTQSKMITDELDGWIITGECKNLVNNPDLNPYQACPIHRLKPYMPINDDWNYIAHFDGGQDIKLPGSFMYHHLNGMTLDSRNQNEAANFHPTDIFDTDDIKNNYEKTDPAINVSDTIDGFGRHMLVVSGGSGIVAIDFDGNELSDIDGSGIRVQISGKIAEGVEMSIVEPASTTPTFPNDFLLHSDPAPVVRKPIFDVKSGDGKSEFFSIESPNTGFSGNTWLVINNINQNDPGLHSATIYGNSGVSLMILDHDEPKAYSYAVTAGDVYQHIGYCPESPTTSPGCIKHGSKKRVEIGLPTSFFGIGPEMTPIFHIDHTPLYTNNLAESVIFDHKNGEIVTFTETTKNLVNVYSYVRIPIGNFGAVEITDARLETKPDSDGNRESITLPYLDGLYDPLNEHSTSTEYARIIGTDKYHQNAEYIYFPLVPKYHNIAMSVGDVDIRHAYADFPLDQFIIAERLKNTENYRTGGNLVDFTVKPKAYVTSEVSSEVTMVKPIIADRDGDARIRVEMSINGNGYIENSKLLKVIRDSTPGYTESIRSSDPLKTKVTIFVNGEQSGSWNLAMDNTSRTPTIQCDDTLSENTIAKCTITYNIQSNVNGEVVTIPNIKSGDFIEFMITATMHVKIDDPTIKLKDSPAVRELIFQWSESEMEVEIKNPFITVQIR